MSNCDIITPAQVKAARALLAWSQQELAVAARVSASTVADFERSARTPMPNNAAAIREALEGRGIQFAAGGVLPAGAPVGVPSNRPGAVMRWISASDLVAWAARNDGGKAKFPELISRLIYAEKGPAARVSFPSDDSTHYHGWDGQCLVAEASAFVPAGQSGWELGAQRDGLKGKADDDYDTRTKDPQGLDPATTTFVFATLQRWAPKGTWAAAKRKHGHWADVRALDADDLVHWLDTAPAVAQWLAQQIGRRPEGLTDLAEAWREWSLATDPALTEDLLLTDREDDATAVHKWLQDEPSVLSIQAEAPQEAVAFLHGAMSRFPAPYGAAYESRCVVVSREQAARALINLGSPLIVVLDASAAPGLAERLVEGGHHVFCAYGPDVDRQVRARSLARPWRYHLELALRAMGLDDARAHAFAAQAGRSIAVLRRIMPASFSKRPTWADDPPPVLLAAMLAGAWRADSEPDRQVLSELAAMPYEAIEEALAPLAARIDPPVRKIGHLWRLTSLRDTWILLAPRLTDAHLGRLTAAFQSVLGEADLGFDVTAMDRWLHGPEQFPTRPSEDLRRGLIEALTALAVFPGAARAVSSPKARAEQAVTALLDGADTRLWWSLSHDFRRLAEVAPNAFMRAVDTALDPPDRPLLSVFRSEQGPMTTQEYQADLLWALEMLAWDADMLPQAARLLARLVAETPTRRTGNRPGASLRRVFLSWYPQTYASLSRRFEVIDRILHAFPAVGWNLLLQLAPHAHDTTEPSPHPLWRDFMPERLEPLTRREVFKANREVEKRLLDNAGHDVGRWASLLDGWSNFDPAWRAEAGRALAQVAPAVREPAEREYLRDRLRSLVRKHRNFAQADWALDEEDLTPLESVLNRMTAGTAAERRRWLFQTPDFMSPNADFHEMGQQLRAAQREAVEDLLGELDDEGLVAFAGTVRLQRDLGMMAGLSSLSPSRKRRLLETTLDLDGDTGAEFSSGLIVGVCEDVGFSALDKLWDEAATGRWSDRALLRIALLMPSNESTWDKLDAGPPAVRAAYWASIRNFGIDPSASVVIAAENLIGAGRARAAVWLLGHRIAENPPADLLVRALMSAGEERPGDEANDVVMFSHFLGIILDHLDKDPVVREMQVVELEWRYFSLLRHGTRPPRNLSKALATYPEFFVQLICLLYGPSPESGVEEPEPEDRSVAEGLASQAFHVLHEWKWVPGADESGVIDRDALDLWLKEARRLCREKGREEAGDRQIGDIFVAAPGKGTAAWPPEPIRDAVEQCRSRPLERGFEMGVVNRHGVTVRAPLAGGDQEREWATYFRDQARRFEISWDRTASLLDRVAENFEDDARRQDVWTEQREG